MPGRYAAFPRDKGFFNRYSVADPGDNSDLVFTVPANLVVLPLAFSLVLTVANAGAARPIIFQYLIPIGTTIWEAQYPVSAVINATTRYSGHLGQPLVSIGNIGSVVLPMPELYLTSLDNIRFTYALKNAADRITAAELAVLEWRDTP